MFSKQEAEEEEYHSFLKTECCLLKKRFQYSGCDLFHHIENGKLLLSQGCKNALRKLVFSCWFLSSLPFDGFLFRTGSSIIACHAYIVVSTLEYSMFVSERLTLCCTISLPCSSPRLALFVLWLWQCDTYVKDSHQVWFSNSCVEKAAKQSVVDSTFVASV